MAPSTSSVAAHLPSLLPTPEITDHSGSFISGEPFKLFFKGLLATLDEFPPSPIEAVILAPAGPFVHEIASSLRPDISGRLMADYRALRNGLAAALELNILHVQAVGDSKLLEDQVTGAVKIYSSAVRKLANEVIDQINQLEIFELVILPRMERHSTAWDLAHEFSKQSDRSAETSRGKMIATQPSTDLCLSISVGDETPRVNSHKQMMVTDANTHFCTVAFPQNLSSYKMKTMMVVEPATNWRCNICLEDKTHKEMLTLNGCAHTFCVRCVMQQTESDLKGGRIPRCPEPGCKREMQIEQCRQFLSTELFELFNRLLAEASIPEHERLYCPYSDCSELFLKTPSSSSSSQTAIWKDAMCVSCKRNFCLSCEVPSHAPLSCAEYQELPSEDKQEHDLRLFELAALSQWKRCGQCRMMIQRTEGCAHMTCRCGYQFCYNCQALWKSCSCPPHV